MAVSLHQACAQGRVEEVEQVLARGGDVDGTNGRGETALYVACARNNVDAATLLLQSGADVDLRPNHHIYQIIIS